MTMNRRTKDNVLMGILGFIFFLNILLLNNFLNTIGSVIEELILLGWILLGIGALLVVLSALTLIRKGTDNLVEGGIFGIVRHPMYVGGMVLFISHIFFGQNLIIAFSSLVAAYCCYLLVRSEDKQITERFGDRYRLYAQRVPMMNLAVGIARRLRRTADE
ncbi:MAG: isoprenylcysteine carboxylmethyltransferase family protein [Candidatus Thermoplasmatota archaeon]|nr:isoprenylcysteine carboxylmethyltransferase family protein [Candidatus Thermoplasmatota archaeon]